MTAGPAWNDDAADVSWTPPALVGTSPITRYLVDLSTDDGATWNPVGWTTTAVGTFPCGGATGQCVFRVAAENAAGIGAPSLASNRPAVPSPPQPPAGAPDNVEPEISTVFNSSFGPVES